MATDQAREAVASIFLSYMGRAPEYEAMDYYTTLYADLLAAHGDSANAFKALSTDIYLSATANGELPKIGGAFGAEDYVNWIYQNVLGRGADDEGLAYWTAQLESGGIEAPELVAIVLAATEGEDADPRDAAYVANRTEVAVAYAKWENSGGPNFDPQQSASILVGVNEDPATVEAALQNLAGGDGSTGNTLTVGVDNLVGTSGDDVFIAPLAQNGLGAVTNTFESGDSIDGQGGYNVLHADLTTVVSGTIPVGPSISSETNNIQEIHLRAQFFNLDVLGNLTTIDAEHNHGVEQWWSNNSRSDIIIEDIRTRPEDTTFGMRQTDPYVSFIALFDPAQLSNTIDTSDSSLTLQLVNNDDPASELADFPVTGVVFNLNGEQHVVASEDMGAAATYAEFVDALNAALADEEGLDGVAAVLNGDNTITITDPEGGAFVGVGYTWVDGIVPADGNLVWSQVVGAPIDEEQPISTTLVVDNVGRTDQGGDFVVGSFGTGGVEHFDLQVQGSSWLGWLGSTNNVLETVNVSHALLGSTSSLYIGGDTRNDDRTETTTDGRVYADGLTDVRVFDASGFAGELKVGAELTYDSIEKYLAGATDPVQFSYLLGDGGSNLSLWVSNALSADPDFLLEVVGGEGDDRLNLYGASTKTGISVDGGAGYNTIELQSSTGNTPTNAFASFENIQKLVVAGGTSTQDFVNGNMLGLQEVVIATEGSADTELRNLDESLDSITISGKNQTLGNGNSNEDQDFGTVAINNAAAAELTVLLDNTARINGVLELESLVIGDSTLGNSAVRTLNVVSDGRRDTSNIIQDLQAARATTLNLEGTQDLSVLVSDLATLPASPNPALAINASELGGDLILALNAATLNNGASDVITGTAGESDLLALYGATGDINTVIRDIETIQFGWTAGSGLASEFDTGSLNAQTTDITFNAANAADTDTFVIGLRGPNALTLNNLANGANVVLGDDSGGNVLFGAENTLVAASGGTLNLTMSDVVGSAVVSTTIVEGFSTINFDVASTIGTGLNVNRAHNLELDDAARTLVITGGNDQNPADQLTLSNQNTALTLIDVSEYAGTFISGWSGQVGPNAVVVLGSESFTFDLLGDFGEASAFQVGQLGEDADYAVGDTITVDVEGVIDGFAVGPATLSHTLTAATTREAALLELVAAINAVPANAVPLGGVNYEVGYAASLVNGGVLSVSYDVVNTDDGSPVDVDVTAFSFEKDAAGGGNAIASVTEADALSTFITTFRFTEEADSGNQWRIENFNGLGEADVTLSNVTVLDLRDLGVEGLADLNISDDGVDTVIKSNDAALNFEITLTGVTEADLNNENFMFAA